MFSRLSPLLLLVALLVTATGCDSVAKKLGIDAVNLPLSGAGSLVINGETPAFKNQTISRDGGNLPNVFDIKSVTITPSDVTWMNPSKASAANGTVYVTLLVKSGSTWVPFVDGTITITNDQVTAVSPNLYALGQQAKAAIDRLPAGQKPDLSVANGKSASEIASLVEAALRSQNIEADLIAWGSPGLRGMVTIRNMRVNLDF